MRKLPRKRSDDFGFVKWIALQVIHIIRADREIQSATIDVHPLSQSSVTTWDLLRMLE
jgi:hypothetical protein